MVIDKGSYAIPEMRRIRGIHMIGVGGTGMSGIAEVLVNLGYQVTGSDIRRSAVTKRLEAMGIEIFIGHAPEHIDRADVVVSSSAVSLGELGEEALVSESSNPLEEYLLQGV